MEFYSRVKQYVKDGLVFERKHPARDYWIYNYTPRVQFENLWDDVTRKCRGLTLNKDGVVVARPFEKFFNYGQKEAGSIPDEPFEAFEKIDGSLGIITLQEDGPLFSTRGSFDGEQARACERIFNEKYVSALEWMNPQYTYLFEIIYPENRIVVDYGGITQLVLLAAIHTRSGTETTYGNLREQNKNFAMAERYHEIPLSDLIKKNEKNKEGFVIRYASGLRIKVKMGEYLRLHRIVTGISTKAIYEHLSSGKHVNEMLEIIPDEFHQWVKDRADEINAKLNYISGKAEEELLSIDITQDRKNIAGDIKMTRYPHLLFALLDKKDIVPKIWKMVDVKFERPTGFGFEDDA